MSKFVRVGEYVKKTYPIYVANKPVNSTSIAPLDVIDKYTGKVVSKVPMADKSIIEKSIISSQNALESMKNMPSATRRQILLNIANEIEKRSEEFAQAIVTEVGKPIVDANAEVGRCIDTFTNAAEESIRQYGESVPLDISKRNLGFHGITKRFPIGPISMIAPFNFPLNLCAHKIAPAIAAGCPFVLKPSDRTPISSLLLGEVLSKQQDLPEGAFSIFPTTHEDASILSKDDRFKVCSFTGSPQVGWKIKNDAGKKKVILELGGDAACVVDSDLNPSRLPQIASRILFGGFYSQGQSCISIQRVFIHEKHYDQMKQLLIDGAKPLQQRIGDPMDPNTFVGPMITEGDAARIESWINEAVSKGAKVLTGGRRLNSSFIEPTIIESLPSDTNISCKEVFGPVFYIEKFNDFRQVVNQVNKSQFGLQAGVFTDNIQKSYYAFNNIEAGAVIINDIPSVRVDSQPYGGIKDSGFGREGIRNTIEEYTELKLMLLKDIGNQF